MRRTVDEKLHDTLEKRLGESFKQVSERLEQVHKGLGEMQALAVGVGDLKKVLTNVKTRGSWGEVQLGALLEQLLTADQYAAQVRVRPRSTETVDFAIRLPGRDDGDTPVWLPIDAKFPKEDYERLSDAAERGDAAGVETAVRQLEARIRQESRDIRDKYIAPPDTTDFAILYLPTEGLYAEVLRRPGLADFLQRDCRVVVAGPTTLAALLNSLQMGFRTLAIQKRSSEVWKLLAAVKKKFEGFGETFSRVQKKIQEADKALDDARSDTEIIGKRLRLVESADEAAVRDALALPGGTDAE
jgi:DNA recombination protein RmuC